MLFREVAAARAVTSHSCTMLGAPLSCTSSSFPPGSPVQVLGHLLYPEDGCQPGAETLCRNKTEGSHITLCSLIPAPSFKGFGDQAGVLAPPQTRLTGGETTSTQNMQSHGWAKVKEMTVLLHGAQHRLDSATWLLPTNCQLNLPGDLQAPG